MNSNDLADLRAAADGDATAFRRLVERYQDRIFHVCLGFVRDAATAEDLTQEVFLQVWEKLRDFRGDSEVSTWIHRIAVNKSLNYLRRGRILRWFSISDKYIENKEIEDKSNESPDDRAERLELRSMLQKAMGRLPQNQKVAFTLHNVEGLSYEDIARIMECTVSAVESRIHRAKMKLQTHLVKIFKKK